MGLCLMYKPVPQPSPQIAALISKEAAAISRLVEWWCEALFFMEVPGQGFTGMTKVSLPEYSLPDGTVVSVEPSDDYLMMGQDVERIVRALSAWAKAHSLGWQLELAGQTIGTIEVSGRLSDDLQLFLAELRQLAGGPEDPEALKSLVAQVRRKYAVRWR
jgi:hypothetical protein